MKFSTKSTYGLRAMIYLALRYKDDATSLAEIAEAEKISPAYLERLFARMKKCGLITASRGASGGYRLLRSPEKISVLSIVEALEGTDSLFYCFAERGKIECSAKCHCGVNLVFTETRKALNETLGALTLINLLPKTYQNNNQ